MIKKGSEQYLDAKYVCKNPELYDSRDFSLARAFCKGYECATPEMIDALIEAHSRMYAELVEWHYNDTHVWDEARNLADKDDVIIMIQKALKKAGVEI